MKAQEGNYPARMEDYHGLQVTIYEINGKDYLTGEDIGRCLGMESPRKKVNQIYNRNRDELEPHKGVLKLKTPSGEDGRGGGEQEVTAFSETGANLIGMFARTAKAKPFRAWLARLPRQVREVVAKVEFINGEAVRRAFEEGLGMIDRLPLDLVGLEDLARLISLRRLNFTQGETAEALSLSRDRVKAVEDRLKDLGIVFPPVRRGRRKRQMLGVLAAEVRGAIISPAGGDACATQIPPGPPFPKGEVKELGHEPSAR